MKGKLILENGMSFDGKIFGSLNETVGELVFNTGMTGYEELLTDPSYYGQIVVMTYPMIGNYGINLDDMESDGIKLKGFIVKEDAKLPNNFRCEMSLEGFLQQYNIVAFKGIDTRHLTKIVREQGTMKAIITHCELTAEEIKEKFDGFSNINAVSGVSTKNIYQIEGNGKTIGILDFGIKTNIIRNFKKRNCNITVFPWNTKAEEIFQYNLKGLFLSNGPGDPKDLPEVIEELKKIIGKIPIAAICLGQQLLALALGGDTEKLKYGHRGCNHPVKDLERNKIYITSQNHGYVVSKVPDSMEVTHINLNDNSIEGIKSEKLKIKSVQYHPEGCPGPQDSEYLFDTFLELFGGEQNEK
ncbi:MAG: carbamoyl phosphate synthase small subunit [Fusobacteriaceae bacterium]|jgi:carbamoyl-phosphate synthase small subunit|nr:carbamoyl phosphate synthase small subunit [Fusobacteriaceae bacterium]